MSGLASVGTGRTTPVVTVESGPHGSGSGCTCRLSHPGSSTEYVFLRLGKDEKDPYPAPAFSCLDYC